MGMSTRVEGFKPVDDKWRKMKAIHDACMEERGASMKADRFPEECPVAQWIHCGLVEIAGTPYRLAGIHWLCVDVWVPDSPRPYQIASVHSLQPLTSAARELLAVEPE